MSGFKKFLMRGNAIDLAVAVVIGAAFTAVVDSFVSNLLTPLISAFGGLPDFSSLKFTIGRSAFRYGDFINAVIAFLIVATVIYFWSSSPTPTSRIAPRPERRSPTATARSACRRSRTRPGAAPTAVPR